MELKKQNKGINKQKETQKKTKKKKNTAKTPQTPKYRGQTWLSEGRWVGIWMKWRKGIKNTLTFMSTEKCIELLNRYNIHLNLV